MGRCPMMRGVKSILLVTVLTVGASSVQAQETDWVKARIQATAIDEEVRVTLHNGEVVAGKLAERKDDRFGIWVVSRIRRWKRWLAYGEVADVTVLSGGRARATVPARELEHRLRIGDKARVHTLSGELLIGKIQDLDGDSLRIRNRTIRLSEGEVWKIDLERNDSIANGTLIGFGVGAGFMGLMALGCDEPACAEGAPYAILLGGGIGAGIGAVADVLNKTTTTIYIDSESKKKITAAPILTRDKKGVMVTVSF
jgi:hypothetical protein